MNELTKQKCVNFEENELVTITNMAYFINLLREKANQNNKEAKVALQSKVDEEYIKLFDQIIEKEGPMMFGTRLLDEIDIDVSQEIVRSNDYTFYIDFVLIRFYHVNKLLLSNNIEGSLNMLQAISGQIDDMFPEEKYLTDKSLKKEFENLRILIRSGAKEEVKKALSEIKRKLCKKLNQRITMPKSVSAIRVMHRLIESDKLNSYSNGIISELEMTGEIDKINEIKEVRNKKHKNNLAV